MEVVGSGTSQQQDGPMVMVSQSRYEALLEEQFWNKIRNKVWGMIAIGLSVISLLGLLGFGSFLESKIEKQIESASDEFKKK